MDVNTLRIGVTLVAFLLFIALMVHSWSRRRLAEHSAAAMLPFLGEEPSEVASAAAPQPLSGAKSVSDFVNNGWAVFIAVLTVVSLIGCLALLIIASRRRVMAADNTTGHVWDGRPRGK